MKLLIVSIILLTSISCLGQVTDSAYFGVQPNSNPGTVSFVTKIDITKATKDGIYLEGYVVNMPYKKAKALDGKTVRISGKVTIVKAIDPNGEQAQGRQVDTKHILHPKIEVLNN